tara:strand:- start:3079 stop:3450 length:372 start_codon:yes stop_codon:yes gene_type:complete
MAERPTTEVTELKRTSLNQGQGKKFQIVEYEWVPATSDSDGDHIVLSDLDGVDSVLAILSVSAWDGGVVEEMNPGTEWSHHFSRRPATGTSNAPTAGEDKLEFLNCASSGWDGCHFAILVEST